ncbi:MAG: serine/threonine protein kinase [Pirellulaceae bacterium]|nr:serine/threonine protein kinase [Pirellulaceae bacterium]
MSARQLGRFEVGELLGTGTVGTIFAGTDTKSGQQVAIKQLNLQAGKDPLIRARFKRETSVLERLQHPNIVSFYGGGVDDATLYYAMERVDGGTVKMLLESGGALPWPVVVDLAIQLCSALQCAHNHGVVHRDLKPGNLFLTLDGQLKLGDFGIARDLTADDLTKNGFMVGTHAYMAPEQIRGESTVCGKADLYSMGCCLFEMLTNRKPFSGGNYTELFDQHLTAPPPSIREIVSDVPEELEVLIGSLLEKDPDQRPFNARAVQAAMLRIAESRSGDPVEPATDEASAEKTKSARERLVQRIEQRHQVPLQPEVNVTGVLVVVGILIGLVAAAAIARG